MLKKAQAYFLPFSDYTKLTKEELTDLYDKYLVLGIFEYIRDGELLLIEREK